MINKAVKVYCKHIKLTRVNNNINSCTCTFNSYGENHNGFRSYPGNIGGEVGIHAERDLSQSIVG